jgi:hypothetical protein
MAVFEPSFGRAHALSVLEWVPAKVISYGLNDRLAESTWQAICSDRGETANTVRPEIRPTGKATALRKAQQEVAEYHRFQKLSQDLVALKSEHLYRFGSPGVGGQSVYPRSSVVCR